MPKSFDTHPALGSIPRTFSTIFSVSFSRAMFRFHPLSSIQLLGWFQLERLDFPPISRDPLSSDLKITLNIN